MEFKKGETIEWVVVDKGHLTIKREHHGRKSSKATTK